jgi:hypothetical protein
MQILLFVSAAISYVQVLQPGMPVTKKAQHSRTVQSYNAPYVTCAVVSIKLTMTTNS